MLTHRRDTPIHSLSLWSFPGLSLYIHVSLVLWRTGLNTALHVWPHQCWGGRKDHLPQPAGNTLSNGAQVPINFLCGKGILSARIQLGIHQDPQVLFCQAAFQLVAPQHILAHGIFPSQLQDLALLLVKLYEVPSSWILSIFIASVFIVVSRSLRCLVNSSIQGKEHEFKKSYIIPSWPTTETKRHVFFWMNLISCISLRKSNGSTVHSKSSFPQYDHCNTLLTKNFHPDGGCFLVIVCIESLRL